MSHDADYADAADAFIIAAITMLAPALPPSRAIFATLPLPYATLMLCCHCFSHFDYFAAFSPP